MALKFAPLEEEKPKRAGLQFAPLEGEEPAPVEPEEPKERKLGVLAPTMIGSFPAPTETLVRAGGRLAGEAISTVAALRNIMAQGWISAGKTQAVKFGPGDINKRLEDAFILSEASAFDRYAEKTVEYGAFAAKAAAATAVVSAALPAAVPAWIAGSFGMAGLGLLDLRQEEINTGVDIGVKDYGIAAGINMALGPIGHGISAATTKAVQGILGRELGKATKKIISNTALGVAFGGYGAATTDEKWYVEMPAAVTAFSLMNLHTTLFTGKQKPRIDSEIRKTMGLATEVMEKVKPGEPRPLFGQEEAEQVMAKVRNAQATQEHLNEEVDAIFSKWSVRPKETKAGKSERLAQERAQLKEQLTRQLGAEEAERVLSEYTFAPRKMSKAAQRQAAQERSRAIREEIKGKAAERQEAERLAIEKKIDAMELEIESIVARKLRLRSFGIAKDEVERIVAGRPKERITPEEREATAQRLAINNQIPIEEARTIAARRLTQTELTEALLSKTEEALLLEAEARGDAVLQETKYRLSVMNPLERRIYEARRQNFTPEEKEFLASRIPSVPEARARARAVEEDVRAMEEELQAEALPGRLEARERAAEQVTGVRGEAAGGRLRTETPQGEAPPETPAERVRRALVERGVAAPPEEPVSRVAKPSKKAAGQAESEARIARREAQKAGQERERFQAEQKRMMAESKRRILEERALRQARERAASPEVRPAPAPPEVTEKALRQMEKDLGGKATRVAPGAEPAPSEPKRVGAPGATIQRPPEITVGEAMERAGTPPPAPKAASVVERAGEILGERAIRTPEVPEPKTKRERRALREVEDSLDRAQRDREKEQGAVRSLKPRLSAKEAGEKLLPVLPWAVAGAGLAGQALTDDDEKRAQIAAITGAAMFPLLGRGRRFPGNQEWARREVERDAGLRATVEKAEELIYRPNSKLGHSRVQEIEAELAAITEKIPERETWRWDPRQKDIFVTTVGHRLSRMGQAGAMLNRLAQDMMTVSQQKIGAWKNQARKIETSGIDPHPDVELSSSQKKLMNQYIESSMGVPGVERPNVEKIEPRTRLRIAQVLLEQFNVELGEPQVKSAAKRLQQFYDDFYAAIEAESIENLMGFTPLKIENGRYRQHRFREDVFYPPDWMKVVRPTEWQKRVETAKKYQDLIASDLGVPVETVRAALHGMRRQYSASPFNRGLLDLKLKKSTNLDYHLILKTRIGREWDPAAGFNQYLEGAVRRLEYVKRFGKNGEVADQLLNALEKDGWSRFMASKLLDAATLQNTEITGIVGRISAKAVRELSAAVSLSKLGGFAISQMPQMAALTSQGEFPATPKSMASRVKDTVKGIRASVSQSRTMPESVKKAWGDELAADFVANAGIVTEAVHVDMLTRMGGVFPRILAGYIRYGGGQIDRLWRNVGGVMGDSYFKNVFEELKWAKKRDMPQEIERARLKVAELFDEPIHRQLAEKGEAITPEEYQFLRYVAASTFSNRTQYRSLPIDMPLMAADPLGRTFYALMTFSLRATANFNRQLATAWKNPARRAGILAAWALMTGSGAAWLQVQRARRHDPFDPEEDSVLQEIIEGAAYGSLGVGYYDGFKDLKAEYGNPAVSLLGPVWGEFFELGDAYARAQKADKLDPLLRYLIRRLPWTPATLIPGVPTPPELALKAFPIRRGTSTGVKMRPLGTSKKKPKKKGRLKRLEERLVDVLQ